MSATSERLELVERYEVLNIINDAIAHNALSYENCVNEIVESIARIPAADVRPMVRGKWNRTDAYPHRLYCSVCYKTYLKNDELLERWEFPLNFCPNCGADMRAEEGET